MAITTFTNYHSSGYQDVSLELTDYDESSITALKYTDNYNNYNWLTFNSVVIEALSQQDINNGYTGYIKIVALGRSDNGGNQIFFLQQASGSGQQSLNLDTLLLSPDWGSLWWQSGIISGTYTPPAPSPTVFIDQEMAAVSYGDILTATVDLDGGTLEYFAWEQYDAVASSWVVIAGGEGSPVIGLTVDETMSEKQIQAMIRVSGIWTSSAGTLPVISSFVGHWSFDNGDAVADVGPDGTAVGATFGTENGRTVIQYDGSGDYLTIPYNADQQPQAAITVATWLKFDSAGNWYDFPVYQPGTGGYQYSYSIWRFRDDGSNAGIYGKLAWRVMTANGNVDAMTSFIPNTGQWYHVVGTYDGSEMKLYIDGSLETTVSQTGNIPHYANQPLLFGSQSGYPESGTTISGKINGSQDDVRIYSKALSASEVATLHTETTVGPALTDGLIAKYALDDNADDSIGTNDLSLMGGTVSYAEYGTNQAAAEFNLGELRSDNVIDLTGEFTVSFWAYEGTPYTYYSNNYSSFFKYGTAAGSYFDLYLLNGKIRTMHNNATSGWGDNRGTVAVPAGWNHYAMTIDPSSGSKIVYLNGVAQTLTGAAFTGTFASNQKIYLGNTSNDSAFRSNGGKMDDVRIWDRVLDPSEVATIAAEGAAESVAVVVDPSISIALPASQLYGESFIQTLDLQGATEYSVGWQYNGTEGWTSISDVNADKLVPWQYEYYDVRALLIIDEVPYTSNVVSPSAFIPSHYWDTDVTSASLGDTLTLIVNMKGYQGAIQYARNTSFASSNYDDNQYHGDFTLVSQVGDIVTYTIELTADLHQRFLSPTISIQGNENISDFYSLGSMGTYHAPSIMTPDLSGDLVPLQKYGYSPVFLTEAEANLWPAGNNTSHSHLLGGVTYYMPNGLTMGVDQFHGAFGQTAQYSLDADVSTSIGSNDGSSSSVSFVTESGRSCVSFDSEEDYLQIPNPAELSGDTWTISQWVKTDAEAANGRQDFFSKWYSSNGKYATIALGTDIGGVLKAYYRGDNMGSIQTMTGPSITDDEWHHIVYVKDSSEVRIYVDGSEVDQAAFSGTIPSTADVVLGAYDGSVLGHSKDHFFYGFMDDVRFYDRAMDADEVAYWHTETTVADTNGPQTLTIEQFDSYGDTWNGGSLDITDADGTSVFGVAGPANGVQTPAGLSETHDFANNATYSYVMTPGSYPSEITWNIKDADGIVLVSWSNADSVTGTFSLGTPPLYPDATGTAEFALAAGTMEFTNIQSNADGISAGATQWVYSLSPLGDVGQAHGGTAVDFGNFTLSGLPEQQSLTLYYGLIDASGLVLWSTSLSGDTREKTRHELTMWDVYGDGWDGTYFVVTDSNGVQVVSTTRSIAQFDHDGNGQINTEDGKYGVIEYIDLADGDYTWELLGGAYPGEHSFTFVRQDNNLSLASSTASNPISGSFTVTDDVTPPVIIIVGDNPMSLVAGDTFVDPGASAVDAQDGALSVSVTGHENMSVSDDWVAYSGYNLSAPTIDGDLVTSGGVFGHNYSVKKENNIAAGADFELVVEFEDVTLPWTQYDPEFRLRVDFIGNALSAEIKMQAYYAWSASNTFFSGFRTQHNSGQTYSGQTSGGSLVQDGAFKVVRVGSTVTMYRREGSEGEFVQMSSQTSANYAGEARIDMMFQNTPGKIVSLTRSDIQTGAILGDYTISYSATDSSGNTASVNRAVNVGSGAYDPMHGGKLQNVVSFIPGKDSQGVPVYAYSTVGEGNTTKLYFTQDFQTWASFTSYDVSVTGIDSAPTCLEFGQNGKFFLGTVSGKLYEISVGENGIPTAYALLETVSGSPKIDSVIYGDHSNQWIFSYEGKINTVEIGGGAIVQRLSLPAGAKCVDIAEGPNGVAMILKKENNSLEPMLAFNNWTSIVGPAGMTIDVASLNPTEFNHSEHLGKWATADAAGTTVLTTSDLLSWIT